jgi:hypothetical protein
MLLTDLLSTRDRRVSAISLMALNSAKRSLLLETSASTRASVIYILPRDYLQSRKHHKPLIVTIT